MFEACDHWFFNNVIKHSVTGDKKSRSVITGDKWVSVVITQSREDRQSGSRKRPPKGVLGVPLD